MPDIKISALTAATAALGADELAINEAGLSKKLTVTQLLASVSPTVVEVVDARGGYATLGLKTKSRGFDVVDYGADPTGVANSAAAFTAAFAAVTASGRRGRVVGTGTFLCTSGLVAVSNVDVEITGEIICNWASSGYGVTFDGITNALWSNTTIRRRGTFTGQGGVVRVLGATDKTCRFINCRFISEIVETATEQDGAFLIDAGSPDLTECECFDSATATAPSLTAAFGIGGTSTALFKSCRGYAGGGNQSAGFLIRDAATPTLDGCAGYGSDTTVTLWQIGIMIWDTAAPVLTNCRGYAGAAATSYAPGFYIGCAAKPTLIGCVGSGGTGNAGENPGWWIEGDASPTMIGCTGRPPESAQTWLYDDANNGRFRPFASKRYQLIGVYVYSYTSLAGKTLNLGTTVGGSEIAAAIDLTGTFHYFDFTKVNLAADAYLYATPSASIADGALFVGYVVAYDSGGQKGLILDTMGHVRIMGGYFAATYNGQATWITAVSGATKNWSIVGAHIENHSPSPSGAVGTAAGGYTLMPIRSSRIGPGNIGVASFADRSNTGNVFMSNSGSATKADGQNITHGLGATPTMARVQATVAGEFASVTALGASTFDVAIKKYDGSAGTTQTVYWEAEA